MFNIQASVEQAAKQTDMNVAQEGGGGLELPPEGMPRLRLISYIELGVHVGDFQGQAKNNDEVYLEFELSGAKYPAVGSGESKRTSPFTISITLTKSLNEKSHYYKLFKRLNHTGKATHFAQLLGDGQGIPCAGFVGTIHHVTKGEGADKKTYANLRDADGYTIRSPYVYDPDSDEQRLVKVPTAVSPLRCFLWDQADKAMWDSLFIDGTWPDKKDKDGKVIKAGVSKNYFQNLIRKAVNFKGSPAGNLAEAGGEEPDLPDAEQPDRDPLSSGSGASEDPMAGV